MSKNKVFIYVERKFSFKLLVGVIAVLMALAFAVSAACLSPNQSYAKTNLNTGNDDENNIIIEKPSDLNIYIISQKLHLDDILKEDFNYKSYLEQFAPSGSEINIDLSSSESRFYKSEYGTSKGIYILVMEIDTEIINGGQSVKMVIDMQVCYTKSTDPESHTVDELPEYLNGVHQNIPILKEEGTGLPFENGLNKFTNYPYAPVATITISGNVVDASDLPIAGASVSYKSDAAQSKNALADVAPVITDVNGHFEFVDFDPALLPGVISITKEGYTFTDVQVNKEDIVEGKIVLKASVVGNPVTPVNPASEETKLAETNDYMFAVVAGLVIIAIAAGTVFVVRRSKTN